MATSISVRLPQETAKALEELARAIDRPKSYLIQKALARTDEAYLVLRVGHRPDVLSAGQASRP